MVVSLAYMVFHPLMGLMCFAGGENRFSWICFLSKGWVITHYFHLLNNMHMEVYMYMLPTPPKVYHFVGFNGICYLWCVLPFLCFGESIRKRVPC